MVGFGVARPDIIRRWVLWVYILKTLSLRGFLLGNKLVK